MHFGISLKKIIFVQDISNTKLMEFKKLIDRGAELERMNEALHREDTQYNTPCEASPLHCF